MPVIARDLIDDLEFSFSCAQWDLMSDASKAGWTVTENTCAAQTSTGSPYAASDFIFTLNGVLLAESPITIGLVDGVYTIGINPATATTPGSMSALDYQKAQAYLEPVSLNTTNAVIPAGAVTAITVLTPLAAKEYVTGDIFAAIDNETGERVKLTVTADTTAASTTISATGTAATELPSGCILVPIYSARTFGTVTSVAATQPAAGLTISGSPITGSGTLTFALANDLAAVEGLTGTGIAVRTAADTWNVRTITGGTGISIADGNGVSGNPTITNTAPDQTVVLTAGANITITGTYPNFTIAASGGATLADGDYGDITVSSTGTVMNIDAGVVGTTELADGAVTTVKITDANVTTAKIANDAVTDAKLRDSAAYSVIGRTGGTIGNPTDIVADTVGQVLKRTDTGVEFALINSNNISNNQVTDANLRDSAALSVIGRSANSIGDPADIAAANDGDVLRRSGTTLGFGTVATAGLADNAVTSAKIAADAVTYAKIQNVVDNNRVLGRVSGANGNVEELTAAQMQTLLGYLDGTLTATRVPFASGAKTLTDSSRFTYASATNRLTLSTVTAGTGAGSSLLNLGGTITGTTEFLNMEGSVTGSVYATLNNLLNTTATHHTVFIIGTGGTASGDPMVLFSINGGANFAVGIDNSDSGKWKITPASVTPGGVNNSGLCVTNQLIARVGINKDAPDHPLDVAGVTRSTQFRGTGLLWADGNIAFHGGAGTGPSINSISGGNNFMQINFKSGTTPAAGADIFTATYPLGVSALTYPVFSQRSNANLSDVMGALYIRSGAANTFILAIKAGVSIPATTDCCLNFLWFGY